MKTLRIALIAASLALPLMLTGCSLLPTTRKLPVPKGPLLIKTAAPEELVETLNKRWAALDTLTATVEMRATQTKSKEGVAKDFPSCHGFILMRKPASLRVIGQYFGVRVFDMGSDGKNFTLYIPSKSKVVKGSNSLRKKSENQLENMRPGFFFDSMVVRGLDADDLYQVTAETITVEDPARKHFYSVPEYILSISRRKPGSQELEPVRVVRFHRDDLLPYEQDIYDAEGNLETQVAYENYQDFGSGKYPSMVTIKRPLEELQFVLTIDKVTENPPFTDDPFKVDVPEGTQVQQLE
jgi:outer membrane lipoprotein-sorting protein